MEKLAQYPKSTHQEKLLQRMCTEAEHLLTEARNLEEAVGIRNQLCTRLQDECKSSLVVNATKRYIDKIIEARWNTRGAGSDLTNH
jgi:hypothetical protein